ncbi:MAG TPA: hypothetical protein VFO16_19760 [Pseudonocardiaceae bacterium]|nr:hypothetical protein [Pseudonocardiaceae bacterium]
MVTFSGDVTGNCNEVKSTHGNANDGDVAGVDFKIEVAEPDQPPGLHVMCMHSPLWPQPGDQITITASSFGDQPDGGALPPTLADNLEIWFSTDGGVTKEITGTTGRQTTFFTNNRRAGAAGSTFSYGCHLRDRGGEKFSGWRTVQVGDPPAGRLVPVLKNGEREHAIDFVLFPATMNLPLVPTNPSAGLLTYPLYSGPRDPNFLSHAQAAVAELYSEQVVLDHQRAINVWIALDGAGTGGFRDLNGDGNADTCQNFVPTAPEYGFADVKAILHPATPPPGNTNTLRECSSNGAFSAEAGERRVFIHETGHAGWGLADEYLIPKDGGRFEKPPANVYLSLTACEDDVVRLDGDKKDCRGGDWNVAPDGTPDPDNLPDFWVSDPPTNDLMNDNGFARRADKRRINYVFTLCDNECGKGDQP